MIIVSQNKTATINFKNIETLYLMRREDKNGKKTVEINARGKYDYTLGEYKTEERAKEVFEEIMTRYANWENMQVGQPSGICEPVYCMPEE